MLGLKSPRRRGSKDEGEKPFWITFSDLMTALMVLFLVAMAVALMAVTQKQQEIDRTVKLRDRTIESCVEDVREVTKRPQFHGITISGYSVDFGTLVQFDNSKHTFEAPSDEHLIRQFVPEVLKVARAQKCQKWLKRVVVEGFASRTGNYLDNLNLSYLRSQRVLCALLNTRTADALNENDRRLIQRLFLAGGSSFNTAVTDDPARMRRVEIRLEFREFNSKPESSPDIPLDPGLTCPNDSR
jgi:flagellar motor protein MotB